MQQYPQVIVPSTIAERWFVYDYENNLQIFMTEIAAEEEFRKIVQQYRDEAAGEEWADEVDHCAWGKVFQTVDLFPVEIPADADPEDWEGMDDVCEAFAIEHRLCYDIAVRDDMRRYLYRNVACEFRKGVADFHKMPDVPGWT